MQKLTRTRRLPLEGTQNTRDLGGYPCKNGGITRWGVFLRSDSPHGMTSQDVDHLLAYGVSNAIDLRTGEERQSSPSVLENAESFSAFHVSMSDQMHATNFEGDLPGSMAGLYISLLDESGKDIARIFTILAEAGNGVLFHCAVGKDRTGVVAMLLLKLAGVDDADVIADYSITDIYMHEVFTAESLALEKRDIPTFVLRSKPESMRRVLHHLNEKFQSAENYLLSIGITEKQIEAIRQKFVHQPID